MKAGLVERTGDDRTALLGGFLTLADSLDAGDRGGLLAPMRRTGQRAFGAGSRAGGSVQ